MKDNMDMDREDRLFGVMRGRDFLMLVLMICGAAALLGLVSHAMWNLFMLGWRVL